MNELDQARAELDKAREAHAAAMLAQHADPASPAAQHHLQDAVQQGKSAWKGYQAAATAGLAAQIEALVPTAFQERTSLDNLSQENTEQENTEQE